MIIHKINILINVNVSSIIDIYFVTLWFSGMRRCGRKEKEIMFEKRLINYCKLYLELSCLEKRGHVTKILKEVFILHTCTETTLQKFSKLFSREHKFHANFTWISHVAILPVYANTMSATEEPWEKNMFIFQTRPAHHNNERRRVVDEGWSITQIKYLAQFC